MFTEEEYVKAWMFYTLGAAILLSAWWFATVKLPWRELKLTLRLGAAVFFLFPWSTGPVGSEGEGYLSPAWIIVAFETLLDGTQAFWRAGGPLLTALAISILVSLGYYVAQWFWLNKLSKSAA